MQRPDTTNRAKILYGVLMAICAIFVIRAFYLQVIRHDYYKNAAQNYQLKEYQIPAERGVILARNGSNTTPLVLNEIKYTLFADPVYVEEPEKVAVQLAGIIGGKAEEIAKQLTTSDTRYVVIAKKLSREQHEQVNALEVAGVGTREQTYRTYPQGALAAQVLGFVNEDGQGQYGVEQYLDELLGGKPGELKAITDAKGVPLVSNPDNVVIEPERGAELTLTLDIGMQSRVEEILKTGLEQAKSDSGSVVVMDPNNGDIKAMANFPSYDPTKISEVEDFSVLANASVSSPLEVGSIMKTLTAAAALDQGVVAPSTSFYNKGYIEIDDKKITDTFNSEGTQSVESTLQRSLNTGAVWLLQQMGRGSINERARMTWHSYMTKHYFLGQPTGVELAGEAAGVIPAPENEGQGINIIYANTAFGQAMTATPLQMAAAISGVVNGGVYYKPTLIESTKISGKNEIFQEPKKVSEDVVDPAVSRDMINLMMTAADYNIPAATRAGYSVGGKSGTAEVARPAEEGGGYYTDRFNGTYLGFVGGDKPEYVVVVRVDEPKIQGYAGSRAAAPIFTNVINMLLDNFGVTPKSN